MAENNYLDDPGLVQVWAEITKRLAEKLDVKSENKYTLSLTGRTIAITDSSGAKQTVTLPDDNDTTYTLSLEDGALKLTPSTGDAQTVTLPKATDTTYSLSIEGNTLTLTPSTGDAQTVTLPQAAASDTTYTISLSGNNVLTLTPSNGTPQSVTLPTTEGTTADTNTKYTLSIEGTTIKLTSTDGDTQTIEIPAQAATPDEYTAGNSSSSIDTSSTWQDVGSVTINKPGTYKLYGGFRGQSSNYPTGLTCKLVVDSNGTLKLGQVSNRGSIWIGDDNTYSNPLFDVVVVKTAPCVVTMQSWSGNASRITGWSLYATNG